MEMSDRDALIDRDVLLPSPASTAATATAATDTDAVAAVVVADDNAPACGEQTNENVNGKVDVRFLLEREDTNMSASASASTGSTCSRADNLKCRADDAFVWKRQSESEGGGEGGGGGVRGCLCLCVDVGVGGVNVKATLAHCRRVFSERECKRSSSRIGGMWCGVVCWDGGKGKKVAG